VHKKHGTGGCVNTLIRMERLQSFIKTFLRTNQTHVYSGGAPQSFGKMISLWWLACFILIS
jgi:hypothetical protein